MIILDEKKYAEQILRTDPVDFSKPYQTLSIIARYYYHMCGCDGDTLTGKLHCFMELHYPRYNPLDWTNSIESCAKQAAKYPICQCSGVWITQKELDIMKEINDKVLERLAFTLLCLAKYHNFKNKNNQNWVNNPDSEIYRLACITTNSYDKDIRFYKLKEMGLIDFAKKIDNLSMKVLFVHNDSEKKLCITDFRKLGYEWRLYKGEDYIRCSCCNILVRKTSVNKKYCKDCVKKNPYYTPVGVKTILCQDCGKTFNADASSRECRCEACKTSHRKELQRMKMRRYRNKTAV